MQTPEYTTLTATQDFEQKLPELVGEYFHFNKNTIFDEQVWFLHENALNFQLKLPGFNKNNVHLSIENTEPKVLIVQPRGAPERRFEFPKNDRIIYDDPYAGIEDGILSIQFSLKRKVDLIRIY